MLKDKTKSTKDEILGTTKFLQRQVKVCLRSDTSLRNVLKDKTKSIKIRYIFKKCLPRSAIFHTLFSFCILFKVTLSIRGARRKKSPSPKIM